jgi:hypothetical protein
MAASRSVGQFDTMLLSIAQHAAVAAVSAFRTRTNIAKSSAYPLISCRSVGRGYTEVCVEGGHNAHLVILHREVQDAVNTAITNAALQQNRSTMTSISKPLPATLGQTELEIIELEDRLRKRKAKSRVLDERVQQLRSHAASLRYPSEPSGAERVISFRKRYEGPGAKVYVYAAIRVNGRWYTTGSTCPASGFTWRGLVDFIREDNQLVKEGFDLFELLHREPLPF